MHPLDERRRDETSAPVLSRRVVDDDLRIMYQGSATVCQRRFRSVSVQILLTQQSRDLSNVEVVAFAPGFHRADEIIIGFQSFFCGSEIDVFGFVERAVYPGLSDLKIVRGFGDVGCLYEIFVNSVFDIFLLFGVPDQTIFYTYRERIHLQPTVCQKLDVVDEFGGDIASVLHAQDSYERIFRSFQIRLVEISFDHHAVNYFQIRLVHVKICREQEPEQRVSRVRFLRFVPQESNLFQSFGIIVIVNNVHHTFHELMFGNVLYLDRHPVGSQQRVLNDDHLGFVALCR